MVRLLSYILTYLKSDTTPVSLVFPAFSFSHSALQDLMDQKKAMSLSLLPFWKNIYSNFNIFALVLDTAAQKNINSSLPELLDVEVVIDSTVKAL